VILDPQAVRLATWFAELQARVGEVIDERLHGACLLQLERVGQALQAAALAPAPGLDLGIGRILAPEPGLLAPDAAPGLLAPDAHPDDPTPSLLLEAGLGGPPAFGTLAAPAPPPASRPAPPRPHEPQRWKITLERDIRPALHRARGTLRAAAASFADGSALTPLREEFAANLARQPQNLTLDVPPEDSSVAPARAPARVEVPLRRWLGETLQPTVEAQLAALDARLAAVVHDATAELERIETVLDYHLFLVEDSRVHEQHEESARTGLAHGVRLVQQLAERLARAAARVHREFVESSSAAMDDALAPLRVHRPEDITQGLAALEARRTPPWWRTRAAALRGGLTSAYGKAAPVVREVAADLRGLLQGEGPRVGHWDLAIASDPAADDRLPPIYRRLFGEIPLGMSDLYRPRPALESAVRKVFETWLSGQVKSGERLSSLLVVGDRGAGKRTLVNRVRAELHGELPVRWLSLGPAHGSEASLCAAIADLVDAPPVPRFRDLAAELRRLPTRQAIVLENSEQLFLRTPDGLARVQAFLDLVRATDDALLWIVLMVSPTATLLDTCLRLPLYFGQVVRVGPEPGKFLEEMLRARHRVSGLGLRFRARRPPVLERLRRPFTRADVLPDPGEEWFLDLEKIAAGNLQQALTYWQLAARVDPSATEVLVRPLPRGRGRALTQLTLSQRLVLATLVQHGALTEAQILATLPLGGQGAAPEIDDLRRRRLLEPSDLDPDYLQLRAPAVLPVTLDLRWRNML
jgi:hypothetical protein